jgi:hypothetical protein
VRLPKWIYVLGIACSSVGCMRASERMHSDTAMIAQFTAHRAQFEQLVKMLQQDRIVSLSCADAPNKVTGGWPPISAQRSADYANILKTIGCVDHVEHMSDDGRVIVPLLSDGWIWAGEGISIEFIPGEPPKELVGDTNPELWTQEERKGGSVTRHIDGPWYLAHDAN